MRARRTPAAKFEAEPCGARAQRRHQLSTACKMQVKVVLRRLAGFSKYLGPDAQLLKSEVQLPIKKEEVELPYVKEEDDITMSTAVRQRRKHQYDANTIADIISKETTKLVAAVAQQEGRALTH
ncbi:uncharacterized protein LOC130928553 isoform X3 [Corythoichthys intestinalis]|uniref:uncharacterized protein LOC130928553 isoform X3 n=1 Tax=Corythoichthys intestinalis TaxID=161448 RepID=UPI0025A560CC|nr:uncharacterized protein LOC130928553 isoform X3 [Corythoichthys intestinalis]